MKKRQLIDIIPSIWFSNKETFSVFLRIYNILRVSKEQLMSKSKIIDFNNVIVVITWLEGLQYLSIATIIPRFDCFLIRDVIEEK